MGSGRGLGWLLVGAAIAGCGRINIESSSTGDGGGVDDVPCSIQAARSWAIPNGGSYAAEFPINLGADDPAATVYFTTDGALPSRSSLSAVGTATNVMPVAGQPVRYFTNVGCADEAVHDEVYTIDTSLQQSLGFIVRDLSLVDGKPVAVVAPGDAISGSGMFQWWYYPGCPNCITQVVYGIEDVAAGCAVNAVPGVFPGMNLAGTVTLTAPSTPGTYNIYTKVTTQFSCNATAMASYAASAVAENHKLGVIVVR